MSGATGKQEDLKAILGQKPSGYDRRLLRNVYVLSITMGIMTVFLGWQYYQSLYVYNGLGATSLEVGIFFSVASLAHALSGVPVSLISDKHGRKKFIIAGTFINGFVYMSYALCGTWFLLMIPIFVLNLVHAAYINPMLALLAESAPPEKRGMANGVFQAVSGLISFFAPLIAMTIILQFGQDINNPATLRAGMPVLFAICGGTQVIMAVARSLALRETHTGIPLPKEGLHLDGASTITGVEATPSSTGAKDDCDVPGLRSRSVVGFYVFVSIAAVISAVVSYFIPIYGQIVLNLRSPAQFAILFSVSTGVSTLVQLPTGRLSDSSRKKALLLTSVILFAFAIILFLKAENFDDLILAQIPFSAAGALLYNTEFVVIACYARRRNRSTAFSIQTAINDIASIPWPLIGGLLFGISPQLPFEFSLIVTIPAFIAGAVLVHEPSKPTAE